MRYLNEITFVKKGERVYDYENSQWIESDPVKTTTMANVTDLGTSRSVELFGNIDEGAKVIRTLPLFIVPEWDYIEFGGKTWELTTHKTPRDRTDLIVKEVVINADEP